MTEEVESETAAAVEKVASQMAASTMVVVAAGSAWSKEGVAAEQPPRNLKAADRKQGMS